MGKRARICVVSTTILDFAWSSLLFDTLCLNCRAGAPTFNAHRIPHGQVWPLRAERQKEPRLNPPIPKKRQAGHGWTKKKRVYHHQKLCNSELWHWRPRHQKYFPTGASCGQAYHSGQPGCIRTPNWTTFWTKMLKARPLDIRRFYLYFLVQEDTQTLDEAISALKEAGK